MSLATLQIRISNPEKHGQSPNIYITYEVSTTGLVSKGESSVRRRYSDFVWLRAALAERSPTALVPSLADKERLSPNEAAEARFIEQRRRDLERFCFRVASHPSLSQCKELRMFLEARVWAIESSSSSASISSLAGGVAMGRALFSLSKDADDVLRRITGAGIDTHDPEHQRLQNLSQHTTKLEEALQRAHEGVKKMHKRHEGVVTDLTEISASFSALAQADDELSDAYRKVSSSFDKTGKILGEQAVLDDLLMREPLRGVILDTIAARDVIRGREAAVMRLVDARELRARLIKDLEHAHLAVQQPKQQTAFQLFAASLSLSMTDKPEERINAVKLKVKEADLAISDAETGLQEATQSTSDEIRRFHRTSVHDVKNLLVDYAKSQTAYHQRVHDVWADLIPHLESVETGVGQAQHAEKFSAGDGPEVGGASFPTAQAMRAGDEDEDETLAEFED